MVTLFDTPDLVGIEGDGYKKPSARFGEGCFETLGGHGNASRLVEGIFKPVGMVAIHNVDGHSSGETGELVGAGIRNDEDGELGCATGQETRVLEGKGSGTA